MLANACNNSRVVSSEDPGDCRKGEVRAGVTDSSISGLSGDSDARARTGWCHDVGKRNPMLVCYVTDQGERCGPALHSRPSRLRRLILPRTAHRVLPTAVASRSELRSPARHSETR